MIHKKKDEFIELTFVCPDCSCVHKFGVVTIKEARKIRDELEDKYGKSLDIQLGDGRVL